MKNRKLKPVVKRLLYAIIFMLIGIAIYQLFTIETEHENYVCNGGIIKLCGVRRWLYDFSRSNARFNKHMENKR